MKNHETPLPRRDFLRNSLMLALPATFGGIVAPAVAATMSAPQQSQLATPSLFNPPSRARGSAVIDVRNHGAVGNGTHDDTTAFQNAINALPSAGGTVHVPAGTYLLDPVRKVMLRSRMHLRLANGAVLKAKANAAERSYLLMLGQVSDVEISGGEIQGDRHRHLGTAGEWGHGIMARGSSRITIRDILIRDCWGDGISIAATTLYSPTPGIPCVDVAIANIACIGNRRQGMSVGRSQNVRIYDSEFSYTSGVTPGCGIDIESDYEHANASNIHIENCIFRYNQGNGIQAYKRSEGVTIKRNTIERNQGYGILVMGSRQGFVALNTIRHNQMIGIGIRAQSNGYVLAQNRFYNNARQFRSFDRARVTPAIALAGNVRTDHTEVKGSSGISINTNLYEDNARG